MARGQAEHRGAQALPHARADGAPDVVAGFREQCSDKLEVLTRQRDDLAEELATLLADIASGRVVPRVYRQFRMYNDPAYRVSRDGGKA